jgi:hypothetical protein
MRWLRLTCSLLVGLAALSQAQAADGKLFKVLPQLLDLDGKHTVYPSLFERDEYQDFLRKNPDLRSGLRFAVHWRAKHAKARKLKLRIEMRGSEHPSPIILEKATENSGWLGRWDSISLLGDDYRKLGELLSWRATLLEGERVLSEKRSFLWGTGDISGRDRRPNRQ